MNLKDLRQEVVDCIEAGIAVHLKSSPGIGKSDFVEQLREYLSKRDGFEWGLTTCFLATMTPTDMMGFLVPYDMPDGTKGSMWTTPAWMITSEGKHINSYKRSLVFLDEYGQGDGDTKRVSAQLKLKLEVGPHRLNKGTGVISASNYQGGRDGVTKDYDFCINREASFDVTNDVIGWTENYAIPFGVQPLTIAFANQHPEVVFTGSAPEKQGPWCTPRSLVKADNLLKLKADRGETVETPATLETIAGIIGQGAAAQLFAFVKLEREMPKYETIIKDPEKCRLPSKPDAKMLVAYNLAHRVDEKDIGPVVKYMERMDKEFAVTFLNAACRRNAKIVATPAVQKWALENSSLMAQIAK